MHTGSHPPDFENIGKILVVKLRHIGDVLLTVPVFRALRENFPDAHIAALVNSGTEEVLKGNPLIDEIITFDRNIKKMNPMQKYMKELSFLKMIRRKGFDMTVELGGSDRAAILSFVSGAAYRIGWKAKRGFIGKKYLYTHLSRPDKRRHMVLNNLDIIRQFGVRTENLSVDFHVPQKDREWVVKILEENNPSLAGSSGGGRRPGSIVVHVHPTSRWMFKCWKDEYVAEIVRWLLDKRVTVIVTSSPDKQELDRAKHILSLVFPRLSAGDSRLIDLCGKTTIKQLGALSLAADLFFGVDTAPMHIAAAVGTPVVAIFGPSRAFNWGPWDNGIQNSKLGIQDSNSLIPYSLRNGIQTCGMHTVIQKDWECIPCGKASCKGGKIYECLEYITPAEIKDIIARKLKDAGGLQ
jgi:heptosyltransferase-3